jgi:hypothetical protein
VVWPCEYNRQNEDKKGALEIKLEGKRPMRRQKKKQFRSLVTYFAYSLTLKMEAGKSSERWVNFY